MSLSKLHYLLRHECVTHPAQNTGTPSRLLRDSLKARKKKIEIQPLSSRSMPAGSQVRLQQQHGAILFSQNLHVAADQRLCAFFHVVKQHRCLLSSFLQTITIRSWRQQMPHNEVTWLFFFFASCRPFNHKKLTALNDAQKSSNAWNEALKRHAPSHEITLPLRAQSSATSENAQMDETRANYKYAFSNRTTHPQHLEENAANRED